MARKRMISPDFFIDEKVGALSPVARLIFIGLWVFAEDNGVGRAGATLLRNLILPYDDISLSDFAAAFDSLVQSGMVTTYTVDHQQYYKVVNFSKHQYINHPTPTKLPTDPDVCTKTTVVLLQDSPLKEKNIKEYNIKENKRKEYGSEQNVLLTAKEYSTLLSDYGETVTNDLIEDMSLYQKSSGKAYADHYAALRRWAKKMPASAKAEAERTQQLTDFEKAAFAALHKESKDDE